MKKEIQIPAIHDKNLRTILEKFGVSQKIDNGIEECYNCSKKITWDNLFAIKILGEELIIFCDEPDCIDNSSK